MGGLTRPLPCSHSWGFSPSGTALLILRFSRAFPRGVPTNRALKELFGTLERDDVMVRLSWWRGVVSYRLWWWWRVTSLTWKKILPRRCRDVFTVVKAHSNLRWYNGFTREGLALRLSADSDLSRLEIKKVTGEIEITGGKNLLLTDDKLKLWAFISTLKWWLIIINYHEFIM